MKTNFMIILSFMLSIMSCSDKNNSDSNSGEIDLESAIENAESRRKADPNASGGNKCLLDLQTRYDQIFNENDIITATGFSKDVMDVKYQKVMKNPEYHEVHYKFKNKRIAYIPSIEMKMEVPDAVVIRNIKPMSLTQFENLYKAVTEEEMELARGALNDVTEGNSEDADAHAAMKKAKDQNISDKQIKETSNVLLDAFKEISEGYRVVEGLGDAARWNVATNELTVLQNGVQFQIMTDLSNDLKKNKSVAIQLAKQILEKCK